MPKAKSKDVSSDAMIAESISTVILAIDDLETKEDKLSVLHLVVQLLTRDERPPITMPLPAHVLALSEPITTTDPRAEMRETKPRKPRRSKLAGSALHVVANKDPEHTATVSAMLTAATAAKLEPVKPRGPKKGFKHRINGGIRGQLASILDFVKARSVVTCKDVQEKFGLCQSSAYGRLKRLAELGHVNHATDREWRYVA